MPSGSIMQRRLCRENLYFDLLKENAIDCTMCTVFSVFILLSCLINRY